MLLSLRGSSIAPPSYILLLYGLLSLVTFPHHTASAGNVIKIGYIPQISGNTGGKKLGLKISGALSYAASIIKRDRILDDDDVEIVYEDEAGDPIRATRLVIDMYNKNVSMIIGPENFCRIEAQVATSVGLPIFSYKCSDPHIQILETNMISLVPTTKYVVDMLLKLFEHLNWRKFTLLYEEMDGKPLQAELKQRIRDRGNAFEMREQPYVTAGQTGCSSSKAECDVHYQAEIIRQTKDKTRVYVFMGSLSSLSRFVFTMAAMGLLNGGNYKVVYLTADYMSEDFNDWFKTIGSPHNRWLRYGHNIGANGTLAIVPRRPKGAIKNEDFEHLVREHSQLPPFNMTSPAQLGDKLVTIAAYYLYDALVTWAGAVRDLRKVDKDSWRDGAKVAGYIRNKTAIPSLTGINLTLEADGSVVGEYELLSFNLPKDPENQIGDFEHVGTFSVKKGGLVHLELLSPLFSGKQVLDEPPCGFDGLKCPSTINMFRRWIAGSVLGTLVIVCVVSTLLYKNWKYEQEIAGLLWMIDREDLSEDQMHPLSAVSKMSVATYNSIPSYRYSDDITVRRYKGTRIVQKKLRLPRSRGAGDIPRRLKKEMKLMRDLYHHNINPFVGALLDDTNHIHVCGEYCAKGSLNAVLEGDYNLDNVFISSLVMDLIKGLEFLHQSPIRVHGNLKSPNCLITNKWTLQISDFGVNELRFLTEDFNFGESENDEVARNQFYKKQLWRSPQQMRARRKRIYEPPTQKDDVYSFAIILHEIMGRQGTWGGVDMEPVDVFQMVCTVPASCEEAFRPPLREIQCQDYVVSCMRDSWSEYPTDRPDIANIAARLKKMRQGMKNNIVDDMISRMEKWADNLELVVAERTQLLEEEKRKTETLLHQMLPKSVAAQLMRGQEVMPESFESVTIYFSDIVGFTEMSSSSTPMEVLRLLNDLYTLFDSISHEYDVYKVETIGDAYMAVSGLPERNGSEHAKEIALMALALLKAIDTFRIKHRPDQKLKLRIGIHTGMVVAGVVGLAMPRYCLFGDTVNTASRMESTGEALQIHVSSQTKAVLDSIGGFHLEERGLVNMKGKGQQLTYWLRGADETLTDRTPKRPSTPVQLFTGTVDVRRASLIPVESSDTGMNGAHKLGRPTMGFPIQAKRPSQVRLHSQKHSAAQPFFINLEDRESSEEGPYPQVRRNGTNRSLLSDDCAVPLLPKMRTRFETDFNKRCLSLDNGLSGGQNPKRVGRFKNAVNDILSFNSADTSNSSQRSKESVV